MRSKGGAGKPRTAPVVNGASATRRRCSRSRPASRWVHPVRRLLVMAALGGYVLAAVELARLELQENR